MISNNANIDINVDTKFGQILFIHSHHIEQKTYSDINMGCYSVTNLQKRMSNNPKIDFINIIVYTKFGQKSVHSFSRYSQDFE